MHIVVFVCALTKYVRLFAVRDTSAAEVLRTWELYLFDYGLPSRVITDRGSCFTSKQFQIFLNQNGVKHILNSSRHPRANGQVERVNRTLVPVIVTSMTDEYHWDEQLPKVQRDLNANVNETTGKTAFECLYGFNPPFYDGVLRHVADKDSEWIPPHKIQEEVRAAIKEKQKKTKLRFDKSRWKGMSFNIGDVVVMRRGAQASGESTKLQEKYKGPLVIIRKLPSDTYEVIDLNSEKGGKKLNTTAHVSQLKRFTNTQEDSLIHLDEENDFPEIEHSTTEEVLEKSTDTEIRTQGEPEASVNINTADDRGDNNRHPVRVRRRPKHLDDFKCSFGEDTE